MRSPTANTLRHLRAIGYEAGVVERFNPHVGEHGIRQDLFGWMDVLAIRGDKAGSLGIQSTSRDHASHRLRKMVATPALRVWLKAGNRAELWTWAKVGRRWRLRRREVTVADLREVVT